MSSSPETSVFELKINQMVLSCTYCLFPFRPDWVEGRPFTCAGGHYFCGECTSRHEKACISYCHVFEGIIAQMKFKCNYCDSGDEYMPYPKFFEHCCNTPVDPRLVERQVEFVFLSGDCILNTSLLECSECKLPLQPPIFRHLSRGVLICGACYPGDIVNYIHCRELDYLVQDEEETERHSMCNIHGKNKQKAHYEVGKMDKHIVHGDEVRNDDDSFDKNHPEIGNRVAETVLKTSAHNKRSKIAKPSSGLKTGDKIGAPMATLHPANN